MLIPYHRQILQEALKKELSPRALKVIIRANVRQDYLRGQFGHDEYHFDNNAFEKSYAYIEENRAMIRPTLEAGKIEDAWAAFGRLTHTAQDFYAHSNYIPLWLAQFDGGTAPPVPEVVHDDHNITQGPDLRSGKLYYPLELFSYIPLLKKIIMPRLPKDSHAWMNLDSPSQGPMFAYTYAAAVKVTRDEWMKTLEGITREAKIFFQDIDQSKPRNQSDFRDYSSRKSLFSYSLIT